MEQVHAAHGAFGRAAYVMWDDEEGVFVLKKRSVGGILRMWEDESFEPDQDIKSRVKARKEAKDQAIEEAEHFVKEAVTNVEKMAHIMNYSEAGPLIQAFVLEAIRIYAEQVIEAGPEKMNTGFVSGRTWVACAEDVVKKLGS